MKKLVSCFPSPVLARIVTSDASPTVFLKCVDVCSWDEHRRPQPSKDQTWRWDLLRLHDTFELSEWLNYIQPQHLSPCIFWLHHRADVWLCTVCRLCAEGSLLVIGPSMDGWSNAACNSQCVSGIKPGVVNTGVTGPTSQIPGLSQTADESTPAVERISGRRVGIFETDSEYVKLAKGGGHKGKGCSECAELQLLFLILNMSVLPYCLHSNSNYEFRHLVFLCKYIHKTCYIIMGQLLLFSFINLLMCFCFC